MPDGVDEASADWLRAYGVEHGVPAMGRELTDATIPAEVPRGLLDAYLDDAPRMIDFLHRRTRVRYRTLPQYPDYYSQLPGAKSGSAKLGNRKSLPSPPVPWSSSTALSISPLASRCGVPSVW